MLSFFMHLKLSLMARRGQKQCGANGAGNKAWFGGRPFVSVTKAKKQQLRKKKKRAEKFKRLLRCSDEDDLLTCEVMLAREMRLRRMEGTVRPMKPIGRSDYNSAKDFPKKKDDELTRAQYLSRIKALLALLDE